MTAASAIRAGGRITAAEIQGVAPLAAYKSGDQPLTSSTALASDSALVIAVLANAVYDVDVLLYYTGFTAGSSDIKVSFTYPSGATSQSVTYLGKSTGLAVAQGTVALGTAQAFGSNGTSNIMALNLWFTLSVSSTAGNLQLQWAQNTSSGTATTVKTGSKLRAWQIQ